MNPSDVPTGLEAHELALGREALSGTFGAIQRVMYVIAQTGVHPADLSYLQSEWEK